MGELNPKKKTVRVLGIDPGTGRTGFGVLEQRTKISLVDYGLIQSEKTDDRAKRLFFIHAEVLKLIRRYQPHLVAIERLFFNKNIRTAMAVGEAIGVTLLAARQCKIPIAEYTPLQVKEVVVGSGRAKKSEVKGMMEVLLDCKIKGPDDVADALAVAFCYLAYRSLNSVMG